MPASKRDEQIMRAMYAVIKAKDELRRVDLMKLTGITINEYTRVKSFFEEKYVDEIEYDGSMKVWKVRNEAK